MSVWEGVLNVWVGGMVGVAGTAAILLCIMGVVCTLMHDWTEQNKRVAARAFLVAVLCWAWPVGVLVGLVWAVIVAWQTLRDDPMWDGLKDWLDPAMAQVRKRNAQLRAEAKAEAKTVPQDSNERP